MIGDCLVFSLTADVLQYWQTLYEIQHACEDAEEYKLNTIEFTTLHKINNEINRIHLKHLYTIKNLILSLFNLKSNIVSKDALNLYPDDFHTWIDNTGAIELIVWINRLKPLILYKIMKKAQSDDIHLFWSMHKQTNRIARKPRSTMYREFLA